MNRLFLIAIARLLVVPTVVVLSVSCDQGTEERIDRLEADLRGIRSDTRDQVEKLGDRVESAESKISNSAQTDWETRFAALEESVKKLSSEKKAAENMVYLRPNLNGHAPLPTDHGTFLVRIEGIDLNVEKSTYSVHLNIGNPMGLAVQQFTLRGDHGGGVPELKEGQEYSIYNQAIEDWQKTLKPFEVTVRNKTLQPESWTAIDFELQAASREELELIRFEMLIENAHLENKDGVAGAGNEFGHILVDSGAAAVMRTDYGAFLVSVKKAEASATGTRLHIEIGNPYGFTINQCRLVGDYGKVFPKRKEGQSSQEFAADLQKWTNQLLPFEANVDTKLSAFRWNKATILIPGPVEQVKFLRAKLRVENVTLPNAGAK